MTANFIEQAPADVLPRLPLQGSIDFTYRCNNNCRHCWVRLPATANEREQELSFDDIRRIADEAQSMGCREWAISGGEPMLRPDFPELLDYLTLRARSYTINTNGTLITPSIAQRLKRKGSKMVALYGATAEVHDHVTRTPGSFDAVMRGFRYLQEAGAGFTVQLIPMRDNYHQYDDMVKLARTISPHYRVGAPWLYFSACGSAERNAEISRQRLEPREVVELDQPDMAGEESTGPPATVDGDDRLFVSCIAGRREFHVDPYGGMTFCSFVKDPALRFDLRKGTFRQAWDEFIPGLAGKVRGGREYQENCGGCELRKDCRWCAVYGRLEHGRYGAKVEYLCDAARESQRFKEEWKHDHRRCFEIAGITLQVESDLPVTDQTFHPKFREFRRDGPGHDTVVVRHHFELPEVKQDELGQQVYHKPPWAVFRRGRSWVYLGISPEPDDRELHRVAVFSHDYSRGEVYHPTDAVFRQGNLHSLTLLPTDQILLAQLLADRQGCLLHSAGAIFRPEVKAKAEVEMTEDPSHAVFPLSASASTATSAPGAGLLFVGHSEAGKSTTVKLIQDRAEILCDDRNIVRRGADGFRVYGTWSHGEVPVVSAASAPLRAVLFLKQSSDNCLVPVTDRREVLKRLLACVIRPMETTAWWRKTLSVVEALAREVPSYIMEFDKSGRIVEQLLNLARQEVKVEVKVKAEEIG